jgi:tRNA(Ile2) C34 agmatinyltransferase TiaS
VVAHVLQTAARRSEAIVSMARARQEQARRAADMVGQARVQGGLVADQAGAAQLALARRQARELVLKARGEIYEAVRRAAVDALSHAGAGADAGLLVERLAGDAVAQLARSRGARGAVASPIVRKAGMTVEVVDGRRRVAVDEVSLVDEVLQAMGDEVEQLWA